MAKLLDVEQENRRIGDFELPDEYSSDTKDWLEPATVNEIKLKSERIECVNLRNGALVRGDVHFTFGNDDNLKLIHLFGEYDGPLPLEVERILYSVDENVFAEEVFQTIVECKTEEEIESVKKGKPVIMAELGSKLLQDHSMLVSGYDLISSDAYAIIKDYEGIARSYADRIRFECNENHEINFCLSGIVGYMKNTSDISLIEVYSNNKCYKLTAFNTKNDRLAAAIGSFTASSPTIEITEQSFEEHKAVLEERQNFELLENDMDEFLMTDFIISRSKFTKKPECKKPASRRRMIDIL